MPIEYLQLRDTPMQVTECHYCGVPLQNDSDLLLARGTIQSTWRRLFRLPYCVVVCKNCGGVAGYERPPKSD